MSRIAVRSLRDSNYRELPRNKLTKSLVGERRVFQKFVSDPKGTRYVIEVAFQPSGEQIVSTFYDVSGEDGLTGAVRVHFQVGSVHHLELLADKLWHAVGSVYYMPVDPVNPGPVGKEVW